ncbi:MAG: hypothetical protein WKF94_14160 [Solirubrobacteraceae bacterium]
MSVLGGWLLAPLVLVALCFGVGLLAERLAGVRLPGPAVPGVGMAGIIVVAGLLTILDATAELAAPACAALAVAGFVVGRVRVGTGSVAVVVAVVALLAWPSLLSGQASVAGYIKLDDSAIWLGLIAHLMEHGRDIEGVMPSTFQRDLELWLGQGYPVGTFTPVGVTARLTFQDLSNVYQPVICVYGALFALGLYGVVREVVRSSALAGAVAFLGVQASLFAGYVWWGSIKEICVAALLPLFVLVARAGASERSEVGRVLPLVGLVAAAFMDGFGAGGVLWAGAGCLAAALIAFHGPVRTYVLGAAAGILVLVAGSVPAIVVLGANALQATKGSPVQAEDIGKLFAPLDLLQGAGLWPAGDFRVPPEPKGIATALAVAGLVATLGAAVVAVRRRAWGLPALLAVTVAGAIPAVVVGAPWIDAKVLAVTSAVLLTGTATLVAVALERTARGPARRATWYGIVSLRSPLGLLAAPTAVVLVAGCAASTWLAVRDVYVAPRDTLAELRELGEAVDGKGPVLMLLYEGYATRYALYRGDVEGASDLRASLIPSRTGEPFPDFSTVEVDDVDTKALLAFPLLSRRLTPVGSRPPSAYEPFASGEFFETWQRRGAAPVEHLSLGGGLAPAAQVTCGRLRRLAGRGAALAAVPRENPVLGDLTAARLPAGWAGTDGVVRPATDGTARVTVVVPRDGEWRVWVGGAALGSLEVSVDGRPAGSVRHQLDASIGWMRFDALDLPAGEHEVALRASRSWWQAGRGTDAAQLPLGPVALTEEVEPVVERVPSADVDRLCDGRTYDWVEVLSQ